jgi:ABC-2 type transport system ATP-binding protein
MVIEASKISKHYGNFQAVDNLDIKISPGDIYGFLGLNGAGKTTTIRMLLSMIQPTSGSVKLFGEKIASGNSLWNQIGYLVESPAAYPDLTVEENLRLYCHYRKIKDYSLVDQIMKDLFLEKYRSVRSKYLSSGNLQRLGLAKAFFHKPKLLILDEPTNGLDPAGIVEIRNALKKMADEGTTIFLSSHLLSEISKIATRIGIIHEGKLVREIFTKDLDIDMKKTLLLDTSDNSIAIDRLRRFEKSCALNEDGIIEVDDLSTVTPEWVTRDMIHAGLDVKQLYLEREDLEAYFFRMINRRSND